MATILKKLTLLSILALAFGVMDAQPKLSVASAWTLPADTVVYNGNPYYLNMGVVIENTGNAKLDGEVTVFLRYNSDTTEYLRASFMAQDFEVGMQEELDFTDTIWNLSNARYKGGDNILVIWPKSEATNVLAPDTGFVSVYVKDVRTSAENQTEVFLERVRIYPNPATTTLNLQLMQDAHKFEYVRILSVEGKELFRSTQALASVPVAELPGQIVFVEVRFKDGVTGVFKVALGGK